jgi:DNA-binding protein HU-beta
MAERTILVCDDCGRPATTSVTIRINGRNLVKDLCDQDARALVRNARTPKRGRKAATVLAPSNLGERRGPGRPKGSTSKRSSAKRSSKRSSAKRSAAKRSSTKRSSAKRSSAKRTGRKRSGARRTAAAA